MEAGPGAGPSASEEALQEMSLLCRSIRAEIEGEDEQHSQGMHAQLSSLYPCCPRSYWDWRWIVYDGSLSVIPISETLPANSRYHLLGVV